MSDYYEMKGNDTHLYHKSCNYGAQPPHSKRKKNRTKKLETIKQVEVSLSTKRFISWIQELQPPVARSTIHSPSLDHPERSLGFFDRAKIYNRERHLPIGNLTPSAILGQ